MFLVKGLLAAASVVVAGDVCLCITTVGAYARLLFLQRSGVKVLSCITSNVC